VLESFLNAKPLYYDTIDYGRMPRIYASIKRALPLPKIIHIIGTNGKGTTGRFIAAALYSFGVAVGHYTSPHILKFNERIWLNGSDVSDKELEDAHQKLMQLLKREDAEALSYFEYTTLLAMVVYREMEYVVLEAGLGGEYDATAVFENVLTVVTPISIDHEAFLGDTIEEIAQTKLNAIQKSAIVAKQPYKETLSVVKTVAEKRGVTIAFYKELLDDVILQQIESIAKRAGLPNYLQENMSVAAAVIKKLGFTLDENSFKEGRLFGRASKIAENIIVDVGHNTLAATALCKTLLGKKFLLIYNSYSDKNYPEILKILAPIISKVLLLEVNDSRIEKREIMQQNLQNLKIAYEDFKRLESDKEYLVFGSFSVVEAFLKGYNG